LFSIRAIFTRDVVTRKSMAVRLVVVSLCGAPAAGTDGTAARADLRSSAHARADTSAAARNGT
jgi:hypothetical protein